MNDYNIKQNPTNKKEWDVVVSNIEQGLTFYVVATCHSRRFADMVANGIEWMEGEGGEVDWETESQKP